MARKRILILAVALVSSAGAAAADPATRPAPPSEHRLSPEQIEEILDDAARRREGRAAEASSPPDEHNSTTMPVHGEVGFSVGTGGYRSAFGTAIVGLPGQGTAIVSVGGHRLPDEPIFAPGW